MTKLGKDRP